MSRDVPRSEDSLMVIEIYAPFEKAINGSLRCAAAGCCSMLPLTQRAGESEGNIELSCSVQHATTRSGDCYTAIYTGEAF